MKADRTLRLLVYCAMDPGTGIYPIDVSFPGQIELKVNCEAYSGNLRGIKKKPGTTRPADVTEFVRRQPGYQNAVSLLHANTDKSNYGSSSKYVFVVYMVKKKTADDLLDGIKHGKKITKETVVRESE
jgi:E3 SUMO-protein ligase PIAS1